MVRENREKKEEDEKRRKKEKKKKGEMINTNQKLKKKVTMSRRIIGFVSA